MIDIRYDKEIDTREIGMRDNRYDKRDRQERHRYREIIAIRDIRYGRKSA